MQIEKTEYYKIRFNSPASAREWLKYHACRLGGHFTAWETELIIKAHAAAFFNVILLRVARERSRMTEREFFNSETETEVLMYWYQGLILEHDGRLVETAFDRPVRA